MTRNQIGAWVSIGYVLCLCALTETRWEQLHTMDLNNLGDFLAGAFSPLAFLWLVLGFFQQGEELRLQAAELHESVKQQRILAKVALDDQAQRREQEAASAPRFVFRPVEMHPFAAGVEWVFHFSNVGGECTGVDFHLDPDSGLVVIPDHIHRVDKSMPHQVTFSGDPEALDEPLLLEISYFDLRGRPWQGEWTIVKSINSNDLIVKFVEDSDGE